MTDSIEKRVTDMENLVWEIPNLLNSRFARFETALADNTGRLAAIERAMSLLQIDMRDLRGGVTRQLVEQDRRISGLESSIKTLDDRVQGLDTRMEGLENRIEHQLTRLDRQDYRLTTMEGLLKEILTRLPS